MKISLKWNKLKNACFILFSKRILLTVRKRKQEEVAMKFSEMEYKRPDTDALQAKLKELTEKVRNAKNYDELKDAFFEADTLMGHFSTQEVIASIRHTIDTRDEFYDQEDEFFNEINPVLKGELTELHKAILASPFVEELKKDVPDTWFKTVDNELKAFSPEIIEDLQKEAKKASEYQKLIASAQIPFDGKVYTLAGLEEKMNDSDPKVRERAHKAYWGWFEENEKAIGEIYDELVHLRTNMAKKLGYDNYLPLGYLRMNRLDYNKADVEQYRKNVLEDVVPTAQKLLQEQAVRLGYPEGTTKMPIWDEKVVFKSGNPAPKHSKDEMVASALEMYKERDPETGKFFQTMVDMDLLDLEAKPGKAAGGYCTGLPDYEVPFIFSNFNHTKGDVEVLTHEAGHAFQMYSSRKIRPIDCIWPTMESAEIDSMSMEFFTWPWMDKFFDEDADKYRHAHLQGTVTFIPYGVLVDHFQHEVYEHPEWSHEERMAAWRRLEKQYLPHKDYEGVDVLDRGGWWMRQLHIFLDPLYYIDYTLAQACALQYWKRMQDEDPEAFEDYKKICHAGGTLPFKGLVELGGLRVPFEPGCLKDTMKAVEDWYDKHPAVE